MHLEPEMLEAVVRGLTVGFDAMKVGVTMADADGKILYVNQTQALLHNRRVDELVGQDVGILAPADKRNPLTRDQLENLEAWERESTNVRKDGTVFPVLLRSEVVRNRSGEPVGVVTTCEDIGELKEAREALQRSEADYAALVENASYGICRVKMDGEFLSANQALVKMLGYDSKSDLLEVNLAHDVYPDPEQFADLLALCGDPGTAADAETEWCTRAGEKLRVRVCGRAAKERHGDIGNYELIVEDVTRRRQLEEQLRQAQKLEALGQLTGGIAHDFNNILTVIQGNAALLEADLPNPTDQVRADLSEMHKATHRGADLVRKLLTFSRREELSFRLLDLGEVVEGTSATLSRLLPEHIDVRAISTEPTGSVFADPTAIEQILMNLATNARDAMPDGGVLYVETRRAWLQEEYRAGFGRGRAGEYACIVVSDTGVGMDERTKRKLFEPFFTTKPEGQGTGLGMAMIHGLVKQHDGFVHVYSEEGHGTTMKVYIPSARKTSVDTDSSGCDLDDETAYAGTETILVVEDEPQIRRVAKRVLERNGYDVIVAADGEEGLRKFRERDGSVALVLTDVIMPRMGGPALYRTITAEAPSVRFLFMSGHAAHILRVSGNLDPRLPFVYKPWTSMELTRRVRGTLDAPLFR